MIDVQIDGLDRVIVTFRKVERFEERPLMTLLGERSRAQFLSYFDKGAGPNGKWEELKPSTKANPKRKSGKPLSDTGLLKGSIDKIISGHILTMGTNVFYGKYHQDGTKKMVAREFLGWGKQELAELETLTQRYLESVFK